MAAINENTNPNTVLIPGSHLRAFQRQATAPAQKLPSGDLGGMLSFTHHE